MKKIKNNIENKFIKLLLSLITIFVGFGSVFAHGDYPGMGEMGFFGWIFMTIFMILIIGIIVWFVLWIIKKQ